MGLFTYVGTSVRNSFRSRIQLPLIIFVHGIIELFKAKANSGLNRLKTTLFRSTVVAFITSLLVWLSILMYLAFYYAYVPTVSHEKQVHLQFETCKESGMCTFPSAHIELTKRQQLLMLGQSYKVQLALEMPESPVNKQLGMFMVCADFRGKNSKLITRSCRSTMLHYRSFVLDLIYTLAYSPLLLIGTVEEKQTVLIELFEDYYEIENEPVMDVYVEIQSTRIEVYTAKFLLNAHFTGLRYVMFNWPLISAIIGITSNLFFIAIICMISWYQLIHSEEYRRYVLTQKKFESYQFDVDDGSSSSSVDDASLLEENVRKRYQIQTVGEDDCM